MADTSGVTTVDVVKAIGDQMFGGATDAFNSMTASGAYDVYVLVQTGDNSFVPASLDLTQAEVGQFKSTISNFGLPLDPQKIADVSGNDNLNMNAAYYRQADVEEVVLHNYNDALESTVNAYNVLAAEYDNPKIEFEDIGDLVTDNDRRIYDKIDLDGNVEALLLLSDHSSPADAGEGFQTKVDDLINAQQSLTDNAVIVGHTFALYNTHSNPEGPETRYEAMDLGRFEFDVEPAPDAVGSEPIAAVKPH